MINKQDCQNLSCLASGLWWLLGLLRKPKSTASFKGAPFQERTSIPSRTKTKGARAGDSEGISGTARCPSTPWHHSSSRGLALWRKNCALLTAFHAGLLGTNKLLPSPESPMPPLQGLEAFPIPYPQLALWAKLCRPLRGLKTPRHPIRMTGDLGSRSHFLRKWLWS